ncbi:MAG: hypothetical protein ACE5GJ_14930 [Gemmatimonadota bacterium]
MPTVLRAEGDGIVARRIVYLARKVVGPRLVRKSGRHRGLWGKLHDAEAYVDLPLEGV